MQWNETELGRVARRERDRVTEHELDGPCSWQGQPSVPNTILTLLREGVSTVEFAGRRARRGREKQGDRGGMERRWTKSVSACRQDSDSSKASHHGPNAPVNADISARREGGSVPASPIPAAWHVLADSSRPYPKHPGDLAPAEKKTRQRVQSRHTYDAR